MDATSELSMSDTSRMTNMRLIELSGSVKLSNTASLQNRLMFSLKESSKVEFEDGAYLNNQHIFNIDGLFDMRSHSRFENKRNLQIGPEAKLSIYDSSTFINTGTVYDRGLVYIYARDGFLNRNIFYINDLRQSKDVEDILRKATPKLPVEY